MPSKRAAAKADKQGKLIKHAVASLEWKERKMWKLGLDPNKPADVALFKEMNE